MIGVVSHITSKKVLKVFSLEARIVSTLDAVGATRQMKLSTLVKEGWSYDILFPRTQKLQTHTDRHTPRIRLLL